MDIECALARATRARLRKAAIVHDKFHVAKLLTMRSTRLGGRTSAAPREGDDTLKHTRYLCCTGIARGKAGQLRRALVDQP